MPSDETIDEVLSTLPPRCELVIRLRFDGSGKTLAEIGKLLPHYAVTGDPLPGEIGVSGVRAGQIEAKALRMLRHPSRRRRLLGYGKLSLS